jgi:iron complex transport system permease protein
MIPSFRLERRCGAVLAGLGGLFVAVSLARLLVGDRFGWPEAAILEIRAFRLASGLAIGMALATSGVLLQALLRNPLASPYILGLSSGATLGYVLVGFLPLVSWPAAARFGVDQTGAFLGALAVMALVYLLAQRRGWIDPVAVLLVGVVVNAMNGAAIMFLSYVAPPNSRSQMTLWMLGYLAESPSATTVGLVGALTLLGVAAAAVLGRAMDVAVFSASEAHSLGLDLRRLRLSLFVLAGLLTAGSVLLAGPIGFVGLICPHLVRLLIGPRHRPLVVGAALAGGALIVGADTAIKAMSDSLIPIGVITALLGGPLFLVLLWPQLGRRAEE